jgi:glucan phosphoethanolaminetransferase (alkaline phosphatase superfamily)
VKLLAWRTPIVRYGVLVVSAHIIVNGLHAIAHQLVEVSISNLQFTYVLLVIFVAPVAAAVMLSFNRPKKMQRGGAWLLLVSMLGSLLFGFAYHIILPGSDNIFTVMHETSLNNAMFFTSTAIILMMIDGLGSWIGAIAVRRIK